MYYVCGFRQKYGDETYAISTTELRQFVRHYPQIRITHKGGKYL